MIERQPNPIFHRPDWLKIDPLGGKPNNLATPPAGCCCWHGEGRLIRLIAGGSVFLAQYDGILTVSQSTHTHAFAKTCKKCSTKKKSTDPRAGTLLRTDRCSFADSVQVLRLSYTLKWEKLPPSVQWWDFALGGEMQWFNYTLCNDLIMHL